MSPAIFYPVMGLLAAGVLAGLIWVSSQLRHYRQHAAERPELHPLLAWQLGALRTGQRLLAAFLVLLSAGGLWVLHEDRLQQEQTLARKRQELWPVFDAQRMWAAPDPYLAETARDHALIAYGRELIAHTQDYFGDRGSVRPKSINRLNCQSCHLDAGTKPFGNNYAAVYSTYPQMRPRSGSLETISKRVNDCFQRSLNGVALDTASREMLAILAYMRWLGTGVPKGQKPKGAGLVELAFLDRAAEPAKGEKVFGEKCASCHGADGQGMPMPENGRYYPPLWGDMSYNEGAGFFRLSRLAGYVKANMPLGATYEFPQLSDEEAWDVAAFINSQPRPKHPFLSTDWPKIEKKPYDHPFGPYADIFPQSQHKYGPFGPMLKPRPSPGAPGLPTGAAR